jgi:flagellar basal-body rod protein FlgB
MTPSAFGIDVLARVLDTASLRHRVIAQNVANVNTPGYRRLEVTFEEQLAKELASPSNGVAGVKAKVVESDGAARVDENNVDIDREMGDLTKNGLLYQAATQILASRMASLRAAISGR